MSQLDMIRELYKQCSEMDMDETMELILSAKTDEERDIITLISDYILQKKTKRSHCSKEVLK